MTGQIDSTRVKEALDADTRDVADIWSDAIKSYKGIVGVELLPKFTSVQVMIDFGTEQMQNFHKFRHDKNKVDKLRSLFAANMEYIEKSAQQLVAAATPAFPPAAAIGTAFTYLLQVRWDLRNRWTTYTHRENRRLAIVSPAHEVCSEADPIVIGLSTSEC